MNKKFNQKLLNEELARFKQINEYDFYIGEEDEMDVYDDTDNLILGEEGEEDEELPADDSQTASGGADMTDLEGDDTDMGLGDDMGGLDGTEMDDMGGTEEPPVDGMDAVDDMAGLDGGAEMEPVEDEVELDVTELVQGTEEAKASADMANQKLDSLMSMLDTLDGKLNSMDGITAKIDNLENELEKRAPTPEEKIEMRSLDSYPYNLKLTDFWAEKEGQYDVMGVNGKKKEEEPKVYSLTQDEVNSDYNESSVKTSFNDTNEFEEEDIY